MFFAQMLQSLQEFPGVARCRFLGRDALAHAIAEELGVHHLKFRRFKSFICFFYREYESWATCGARCVNFEPLHLKLLESVFDSWHGYVSFIFSTGEVNLFRDPNPQIHRWTCQNVQCIGDGKPVTWCWTMAEPLNNKIMAKYIEIQYISVYYI